MMENMFKSNQYEIKGIEQQYIKITLNPGQSFHTNKENLISSSEILREIPLKRSFSLLNFRSKQDKTPMTAAYINESDKPAKIILNSGGGRILAFNSSLVPKLVLKEANILGHTDTVILKSFVYVIVVID